jgi:preprotein translocase subunit SecD
VAPPAGTLRVGRYFLALLAMFAVLYSIVFWPGSRHTPKLGLDLVGGTQVIFTAKQPGGGTPKKSQMNEAKQIIQDRVNGTGVTEATVVVQGSNRIVVSIPGATGTDVSKLGQAAVLNFRGLVMPAIPLTPTTTATPSSSASSSGSSTSTPTPSASTTAGTSSASPSANGLVAPAAVKPHAAATTPSPTPTASPSATPTPSATTTAPVPRVSNPLAKLTFKVPTTEAAFDKLTQAQQQELATALTTLDCTSTQQEQDLPNSYFLACDTNDNRTASLAYLLGPVIVPGHEIKGASAVAPNASQGQTQWTVSLSLKSTGQANWAKYTSAHNIGGDSSQTAGPTQCASSGTPCADFVAFTLDGVAVSVPVNESAINGGSTQISGGGGNGFTPKQARDLANKLKYGALPLSFTPEQAQSVSATLGTSQLKAGLLAGGIGLVLVVIYSLIYYRALGLVTIASLLVSGGLTYACLVMLAAQIGFTLSLAGIAGFIVAVGITADSFVVFFERIKDEVHDGRSVRVAIPRAWVRARRTILSADTVSFLAAAILYYFAAGDVKGFAFTLGLSTVLDLVVVFLFTHPIVSALSQRRAFASARFTGLNSMRDGGVALSAPESGRARAGARAGKAATPSRITVETEPASSVAVLDRPDEEPEVDEAVEPEPVDEPVATPATEAPAAVSKQELGAEPDEDDAAPRRRTTPAPGSAAERAAARRARMRAERGER